MQGRAGGPLALVQTRREVRSSACGRRTARVARRRRRDDAHDDGERQETLGIVALVVMLVAFALVGIIEGTDVETKAVWLGRLIEAGTFVL